MPRPRKWRTVQTKPVATLFKPQGVPVWNLEEVTLAVEELEAMRLVDLDGLDQESAAEKMGISRPTFSRILSAARRTAAEGLVRGKSIRVEGGDHVYEDDPGPGAGHCRRRGLGRGRGGGGPKRG